MARFERAALTAFSLSKSVRAALAKDQDPGPAIERPREQHTLLLATGKGRTHVPDQALVAHRHATRASHSRTRAMSICSSNPEMFSASVPCSRLSSWAANQRHRSQQLNPMSWTAAGDEIDPTHAQCRATLREVQDGPARAVGHAVILTCRSDASLPASCQRGNHRCE